MRPTVAAILGLSALFVGNAAVTPHAPVVRRLRGVIYSVIDGYRPLRADLFLPRVHRLPAPVIVYLHGGGWTLDPHGDEGLAGDATMRALAGKGYVVVRPEYRLSSEARFPAQLIDAKRAIRWIKTHAAEYGADPHRVMVWGSSAGGTLASLVGVTCGIARFDDAAALPQHFGLSTPPIAPDTNSCVTAVVDWFGPVDFPRMDAQARPGSPLRHDAADSAESRLIGCALPDCPRERVMAASPLSYVSRDDPPFLILHGDADNAVPHQQSEELAAALRAKGVPVEFGLVPGADHMFDKASERLRRKQVARTFAFLDAHRALTR